MARTANAMDSYLYDVSIPLISELQGRLEPAAPAMELISKVFDPKYAFLIYAPLAYLIDQTLGKRLILVTVLAEWSNMVLKWLLHGERPYWYVHSSGHFDPSQVPIQQFPITCELGPGHPSGHAMLTSAVWYTLLEWTLNKSSSLANGTTGSAASGLARQALTWTGYLLLLTGVSVSRVFLGCHFPHQCAAGALLGLLLAVGVASRRPPNGQQLVALSALAFAGAFGTYAALGWLGIDPNWTMALASKHCAKREYIHLDTAPFFSIMRYCGFALGSGLGLLLPLRTILAKLAPAGTQQDLSVAASIAADAAESVVDSRTPTAAANPASGTILEQQVIDPPTPVPTISASGLAIAIKAEGASALVRASGRLITALLMARLLDDLALYVSHANLRVFYSAAFGAYATFSYAFVNL